MSQEFSATKLHVSAFAQAAASLAGQDTLQAYPRILIETEGVGAALPVQWKARGESRAGVAWLHLQAQAHVPQQCQRCMREVALNIEVDRWFRFVADEATADAEDEESEEDLLVIDREFDLHSLVEDEILMELPMVPLHDVCPTPVKLAVADPGFAGEGEGETEAKRNPFAALAQLKKP